MDFEVCKLEDFTQVLTKKFEKTFYYIIFSATIN